MDSTLGSLEDRQQKNVNTTLKKPAQPPGSFFSGPPPHFVQKSIPKGVGRALAPGFLFDYIILCFPPAFPNCD